MRDEPIIKASWGGKVGRRRHYFLLLAGGSVATSLCGRMAIEPQAAMGADGYPRLDSDCRVCAEKLMGNAQLKKRLDDLGY